MNDKLMGIIYLVLGILILVVYFAAPNFFVVVLWIVAILAIVAGVYLILFRKSY